MAGKSTAIFRTQIQESIKTVLSELAQLEMRAILLCYVEFKMEPENEGISELVGGS